jgi:hypothetical protein
MKLPTAIAAALAVPSALLLSGCAVTPDSLPVPHVQQHPATRPAAVAPVAPAAYRAPAPAVRVTSVGWGTRGDGAVATGVLRNAGKAAAATTVVFTAFGAHDEVLGFARSVGVEVRVGETTAVSVRLHLPAGATIARVSAQLTTSPLAAPSTATARLDGVNVAFGGTRVLGAVSSSRSADTLVTAVCTDRSDRVLGGGSTRVGRVGDGGATTFQVATVVATAPSRCSVYAAVVTPAR